MISISINVNKIDKARLFQGKQGNYLDAVLIETPNSEYGDYMVVESISKEEREAGNKGTIIGNGKIITKGAPKQNQTAPAAQPGFKGDDKFDPSAHDDMPF